MTKIENTILSNLRTSCLDSEILVLDHENDVGLEEYINEKAKEIIAKKCIYSAFEENILMLEYPDSKTPDSSVFDKFFESAMIVSKNVKFEGLFAIDVTNYIIDLESSKLSELVSYVKANPDAVYCLVVYTKNENVVRKLFNRFSAAGTFKVKHLALPSSERLTEYTVSLLRQVMPHISSDVEEYFKTYYSEKKYGYEFPDYLFKLANSESCYQDGSLETIKKIVKSAEDFDKINTSTESYGF